MNAPAISVLIPAYDVERYLDECLDSVLSQEGADFEVVCADDGSTDGTAGILERRAAEDGRIRILRLRHEGLAAVRNRLLDAARGDWIFFCDADDLLAPGALRRAQSAAEAGGLDALFFVADVFYDSEELAARFRHIGDYYSVVRDFSSPRTGPEFLCDCVEANEWRPAAWLVFFRRDILSRGDIRSPEGFLHEDVLLTLGLALHAERAARIQDRLYRRRIREGSIMTGSNAFPRFRACLHNALAILGLGESPDASPRTRAALGALTDRQLGQARKHLAAMTDEERARLAAERPCEAALAAFLSCTRTDEEFQSLNESSARKIAALKRKLAAQRRENARLRSSRAYRIADALLAIPRRLPGRGTKS